MPDRPAALAQSNVSLRILLAEDGVVNQRVVAGLLKGMGHEVRIAENGQVAVDAWRDGGFDAILMDWQMPVMDGTEATSMIRVEELSSKEHIPIIAMTASTEKGDREKCLECGMDDYISKPIDPQFLADVLEKITTGELLEAPDGHTKRLPVDASSADSDGTLTNYRVIDLEHARMRMGGCDDDILAELAQILLEECEQRIGEIEDGLKSRDAVLVARSAHTIKGAARNFKATALVQAAGQIERLGREDNLIPIPEILETLKVESKHLDEELRVFLSLLSK